MEAETAETGSKARTPAKDGTLKAELDQRDASATEEPAMHYAERTAIGQAGNSEGVRVPFVRLVLLDRGEEVCGEKALGEARLWRQG